MFTPTLDWGSELWTSLLWIAKGWAIAAVATFVILVLIVRFTTWGRQFWRVTRGYFTGPDSVVVWLWLAGLLLMVITSVRLSVLFSFQGNDMMTSFQVIAAGLGSDNAAVRESGADGFWLSMTVFAVLAVLNVALIMLDLIADIPDVASVGGLTLGADPEAVGTEEIGKAHVRTPVTPRSRMPSSA
mgnify:CR=1 FL=1